MLSASVILVFSFIFYYDDCLVIIIIMYQSAAQLLKWEGPKWKSSF